MTVLVGAASTLFARQPTTRRRPPLRLHSAFQMKTIEFPKGTTRKFALFLPTRYDEDPNHRWPLILTLHGSGEIGTDGIKQTRIGLPIHIARQPDRFPFITIMPQARTMWFRGEDAAAIWAILERVCAQYRVDRERLYITGFSMGGFGTWELAAARPDIFAAAVPICGVANSDTLPNIKRLPVWAFHGKLDKNVPVSGSREAVAELKRIGAKPRYTEYPDLGHQCWDRAYSLTHKRLYQWLLEHRRRKPPRRIEYVFSSRRARVWWLAGRVEKDRKTPARIRAEITKDHRILIDSEGVAAWSIQSEGKPLKPGTKISVTWNGESVWEGLFQGRLDSNASEKAP
ncbi:MAG: prolyl oligopeptidase family serine peptidase [Phycisphaerae bacterium]